MSHKELIKEINQLPFDERQALFESSLESVLARLNRFVFSWTHDRTEAEAIVQETVLRLLRYMEQGFVEGNDLDRYLIAVARRVSIDRAQKKETGLPSVRGEIIEPGVLRSNQVSESSSTSKKSLSQRLYGILKFDGDPPDDEEVKDLIADYLVRKYS